MNKYKLLVLLVFLLFIFFSARALSQVKSNNNLAIKPKQKLARMKILRTLNLSPSQIMQIKKIIRNDSIMQKELNSRRFNSHMTLEKELASQNPNKEKVKNLVRDLSERFEEAEYQKALTEIEIRKALTPEQRDMLYKQVEIMEKTRSKKK